MSASPSLAELATAAGIAVEWTDVAGRPQRVGEGTLASLLAALDLPARDLSQRRDSLRRLAQRQGHPPLLTTRVGGYLELGVANAACVWQHDDGSEQAVHTDAGGLVIAPARPGYWTLLCQDHVQAVAVAPERCFSVSDAVAESDPRCWGLVLQPYAARGEHDSGVGDTSACGNWAWRATTAGADALALGPVHASDSIGALYSPYSPGDRRFFDPIYAAPVDMLGDRALAALGRAPTLRRELEVLRQTELIDWPAAARAKWQWLELLEPEVRGGSDDEAADLRRFEAQSGDALAAHAQFMQGRHGIAPSLTVFGQWMATRGWQRVHDEARRVGMRIGLVADLAVGFDPDGAEADAAGDSLLHNLVLGAPPDAFAPGGQVWGVTGYSPEGLVASGFAPFISLLRAVMCDRGGIRIDHILGLQRLWVVPRGGEAGEGAYLRYPLEDLLNLLALESWRHRCVVIGEDLGVVPEGIRATLSRRGIMGMDVLAFCRDEQGDFVPPARWRRDAVAMTGTHDLPTLVGWRRGLDLRWRAQLGQLDKARLRSERDLRQRDVARLEACLPAGSSAGPASARLALLGHVASSPSPLALLPVEDALGLPEQVNLPGTVGDHPNWRRRLPEPLPENVLRQSLRTFDRARAKAGQ